ncbi:transposase IS200 like protein [Peptococcaceae bacterium CEB3]|nr:transposase IS200 like protein [Peptococcaceae bacterium CEB3]
MARKLREWWTGASYHIMSRGNHRLEIFRDDEDRGVYLSMLAQVKDKLPFILHAYCLMSNHVHFQLETTENDPGKIMKLLNMKYAIFFNRKYRFVGQLMQGRFRAEAIQDERYFLALNRYIHLNPVKAGIVLHPRDYRWSSYNAYLESNSVSAVDTEKTLGYFPEPKISRFEQFTVAGLTTGPSHVSSLPSRLQLEDDGVEDNCPKDQQVETCEEVQ